MFEMLQLSLIKWVHFLCKQNSTEEASLTEVVCLLSSTLLTLMLRCFSNFSIFITKWNGPTFIKGDIKVIFSWCYDDTLALVYFGPAKKRKVNFLTISPLYFSRWMNCPENGNGTLLIFFSVTFCVKELMTFFYTIYFYLYRYFTAYWMIFHLV